MWEKEYSKQYKGVSKQSIWELWEDVNNWPKWHQELEYCKLEEPFSSRIAFFVKA